MYSRDNRNGCIIVVSTLSRDSLPVNLVRGTMGPVSLAHDSVPAGILADGSVGGEE